MRFALVAAFAALTLVGCGRTEPETSPTISVRALYLRPMYSGQAMLVDHEAIPDRMPAMQMPMRVRDPGLLDGVPVGGPVRLTLDSASLAVLDIEALPRATRLDLYRLPGNPAPDELFRPD